MASIRVFDPTTANTKSITVVVGTSIIIQDLDADPDYYIRLSTNAKKKDGGSIAPMIIRNLSDGSRGTTKHDGSALPYVTMSEAIEDHILHMIEGDGGDDEMDFS